MGWSLALPEDLPSQQIGKQALDCSIIVCTNRDTDKCTLLPKASGTQKPFSRCSQGKHIQVNGRQDVFPLASKQQQKGIFRSIPAQSSKNQSNGSTFPERAENSKHILEGLSGLI